MLPLWRELEEAQGRFRFFPASEDAEERIMASFADAFASSDADVLLAVDGGEVVGMVLVHVERPSRMSDRRAVELSRFVVRADRRRFGIGKILVDAAGSWARQRGIGAMVAAIFVGNDASTRFWHSAGFEPWVERAVRRVEGAD
jgi:GNAT superfamily N-acetyltransferase